jgi:hypothetical protein
MIAEKLWRLTAEITLVFDKEGRPAVKKIRKTEAKASSAGISRSCQCP